VDHTPVAPQQVRKRLDNEVGRERGIIAQSNSRTGGVAQFMGALLAAVAVAILAAISRPGMRITVARVVPAVVGGAAVVVMVVAMAIMLWPQLLNRLPHDKSVTAYRDRILREAREMAAAEGLPLPKEFEEGYDLQLIRDRKEYTTRVGLVATVVMTLATFAFLLLLHY